MQNRQGRDGDTTTNAGNESGNSQGFVQAPTISLPKGGGAIRGIGEKFAANPVTGTGSLTIPIATSPGRSGFGPQLSLAYDSGAGNGSFGLGWNLSTPAIVRKTDKGLPRYQDATESDEFILSGAEDLVPVLVEESGNWVREALPPRIVNGAIYRIQPYRPRTEGLFARIERWTNNGDPTDCFWRSISRDNITTWYGKAASSRVADPADAAHIFSWLICESHDDKGNVIVYDYKKEDSTGINLFLPHERNRNDATRAANCYLEHIRYGNHTPYFPVLSATDPWPEPPGSAALHASDNWLFEAVFDYGVHDPDAPAPGANGAWDVRHDPFSTYRAGFEVRTYRLCQRVLMFHHFPNETDVGANCLVRSTDFTYRYEQPPADPRNPIHTVLTSVTQCGYCKQADGSYLKKTLPPVEFDYSQAVIGTEIKSVEPGSMENLPAGVDGANYQWLDLDGEGLSGVLTEQAGAWFYKRNESPITRSIENGSPSYAARLAAVQTVASMPIGGLTGTGNRQFLDLAGDGQVDLVQLTAPLAGFYERGYQIAEGGEPGWESFRAFESLPNIAWNDPNLKFIDLTGDGHADILITESDVFTWYPSLAEAGFGESERVPIPTDEEHGPRVVFADGTQTLFQADLSGDGLTDIVRIRNGEVCYWANLGYSRFGAKVSMDDAPWFDTPDLFDPRRIRLADIDGSGETDIIYLGRNETRYWLNHSGNGWSAAQLLESFPAVDNIAAVAAVDLLGNGTACLVWSSPLPGESNAPLRYVELMAEGKPHLMVGSRNNLGAETRVQYAPSTYFYLKDRQAGKPWITKLPFPVHVVERVTVTDHWRKTSFSSTYSYHHGYFDGIEREFRGFGRVEQIDVESYGTFEQGNTASPYITNDKTLYQPPVKTVTWYHTGAFFDREQILSHFEHEYFPRWFEDLKPNEKNVLGNFQENVLPQPDLDAKNLNTEEWREALRACKGMMLRQEVVELDIDTLEQGEQRPVKLFSTAYHNCHIRRLQPRDGNRHAVFLVAESEAITYHYELDLSQDTVRPDPRIAHTLNLQLDEYANVLQSVAVVYTRLGQFEDNTLKADELTLISKVQRETHLAYSETRYTEDFGTRLEDKNAALDNHRLPLPCEVLTYELTGIRPEDADDKTSTDPRDNLYFTIDELRAFQLSLVHQKSGTPVTDIPYHQVLNRTIPEKRLVEHARTLFFNENLIDPLPFEQHGRLGLTYEVYKLALTDTLLDAVFKDSTGINKLDETIDGTTTARDTLIDATVSGYLSGAKLAALFAEIPTIELAGQYWIRSGIAGFASDAAQHYYLPERYTDPFGNITTLEYDPRDLFVASSTDMLQNKTEITRFDFRVLAPHEMKDINDNLSEVFFDVLGLPTAMALKGNGTEGDNLTGFDDTLANPARDQLTAFFVTQKPYDEAQAKAWLGNATARHVYYFGETLKDGKTVWGAHPACACGIVREQHVSQTLNSPIQACFEYSDGLGSVVVKKVQAEPEKVGEPLRWVANGKTILNNKGKPVKKYEPYFCDPAAGHQFEEPQEIGVTAVVSYDAIGRIIRTDLPDGSFSHVEFSPWHVRTFDPNDTVKESAWYAAQNPVNPDQPLPRNPLTGALAVTLNQRAAWLAAQHADTPALTLLDSLGRDVISVADTGSAKHVTFTKLDAEGKPLWIRDARGNFVMQYITPPVPNAETSDPTSGFAPCYDIAGNLLFQHSMDAGDRWMLNDAAGKPLLAWDSRGHLLWSAYDGLHRPIALFVKGADPQNPTRVIQFEQIIYGDTPNNGLTDAQKIALNLHGKPYRHFDTAGVVTSLGRNPLTNADNAFDFKGNLLRSTRQLVQNYRGIPDWSQNPPLNAEMFVSSTLYDGLNRPIQLTAPHSNQPTTKLNLFQPRYNAANLLERVAVWLEQSAETPALHNPDTATLHAIRNIDYNAKGQRTLIDYNEGNRPIRTAYEYDAQTFRMQQLTTTRLNNNRTLQDLTYTYDPVGNITDIHDAAQQAYFFNNGLIEPHNAYTYDALYRLVEAEGREHAAQNNLQRYEKAFDPIVGIPFPNSPEALQRYTESFDYDAVGNILQLQHSGGNVERWTRRYQYALDSNRLLATSLPNDLSDQPSYIDINAPSYSAKYDYDVHGNMTTMLHLPIMAWDLKDQLQMTQRQSVNNGGSAEKTYYVYDASGQRIRKVTEKGNGQLKDERIYLGNFEIYRQYSNQSVILERETLHIMDDKQRVALIETRTQTDGNDLAPRQLIRYQLSNHLGSAALELDANAQIISYEEYHPYGTTAYHASRSQTDTPKRYRYTGKERDEETSFTYHGARYYIPWLGRWIGVDPLGFTDGTNLFAYCHNSPIAHSDPQGTHTQANESSVLDTVDKTLTEKNIAYNTEVTVRVELPDKSTVVRRYDRMYQDPQSKNWVAIEGKGGRPNQLTQAEKLADRVVQEQGGRFEVIESAGKPPTSPKVEGIPFTKGYKGEIKKGDLHFVHGKVGHVADATEPHGLDVGAWREGMNAKHPDAKPPSNMARKTVPNQAPQYVTQEQAMIERAKNVGAKEQAIARTVKRQNSGGFGPNTVESGIKALPKAVRIVGQVATVFGAATEADKTDRMLAERGEGAFNRTTNTAAVLILGVAAGVVDDAMAVALGPSGLPVVSQSWDDHGSGPVQHAVGEAYRGILKWAWRHGI